MRLVRAVAGRRRPGRTDTDGRETPARALDGAPGTAPAPRSDRPVRAMRTVMVALTAVTIVAAAVWVVLTG